ncbi:MAG: MupA/Atu3671 family FMN-dependent luciferase-like monooxygenase [Phycisphaerales bacterium]
MTAPGRFSCFIMGGDSLLVECAGILLERGHEVRAVVTGAERLAAWAREKGIPVHAPGDEGNAAMAAAPFDYLFCITHLSLVPDGVLKLPRRGAINFHDGPLPGYAGLNTPAWGLIRREPRWGITLHRITSEVDRGDILSQVLFDVAPGDTALTLNTRCFEEAITAFARLVDDLTAGNAAARPQPAGPRLYFSRHQRPANACVLDWSKPAADLEALVRGLDFGRYHNPLGSPKTFRGDAALIVTRARAVDGRSGAEPGTVLDASDTVIRVAAGEGELVMTGLSTLAGRTLTVTEAATRLGVGRGGRLGALSPHAAARLTELDPAMSRAERHWTKRLLEAHALEVPYVSGPSDIDSIARRVVEPIELPSRFRERFPASLDDALTAAACVYLGLLGGADDFDIAYRPADGALPDGVETVVSTRVPFRVRLRSDAGFDAALAAVGREANEVAKRGPWLRDMPARTPELHADAASRLAALDAVGVERWTDPASARPGGALTFVIGGGTVRLAHDPARVKLEHAAAVRRQFAALLTQLADDPARPLAGRDLLTDDERTRVLTRWNATARDAGSECVHELIERQAARTPDAIAVACRGERVTYADLNSRANRLAHFLRSLGVGPDARVGVCLERSIDLVTAIVAVHKAGGAYVPLDPAYPADRVRYVLDDADVGVLLTHEHLLDDLPRARARVVCLDADWAGIARHPDANPPPSARPENLAYLIYTSGSTGKPKGVMVEHRNAVNFFAAMDDRLPPPPAGRQGVWLAVTSLSFDISVLELLYTLARGYKVVVHTDPHRRHVPMTTDSADPGESGGRLQFSLFYFAADEGEASGDKYRLLLEGAKFADRHGFAAVWTPERHFHAFGGLYPNPSVASAALAFVTERVQLRAGSVVLPLHHPTRIAEEWALVDNFSRGRVGVSFASGWQPNDFVLKPENYANRHTLMYDGIEIVRKLWRGEAVAFPDANGKPVEVRTLPRPVQKDLPIWITTAGNIDTWKSAARIGANILTHLLGQTTEEIAEKIRVYRQIYREHNPGKPDAIVSIMLHTFVGDDDRAVKEIVRKPMTAYLGTSLSLVKNVVSSWAAFKKGAGAGAMDLDLKTLSKDELDGLLEFSFERYYETSGLFGTVGTCLKMVEKLAAIGIDDIACLVDFGVDSRIALEHLDHLNHLRERATRRVNLSSIGAAGGAGAPAATETIGSLILAHGVTHFQCTPSMARMVLMSDEDRSALQSLSVMMVGGEAFPGALAQDLTAATPARIINMYGPTETTVWSATHPVTPGPATIPIGRPIANTELYVLDRASRPTPDGVAGELFIGGAGVVRGYMNRPDLTAERFVPDPFSGRPGARLYRTGDLARWSPDGTMEFLGRADFQVKVRGHRIELGEIEAAAALIPGVRECAVTLREDTPGDQRLVAYIVRDAGDAISADDVKAGLRKSLPDYMAPSHVVFLDALPLTPNKKVDRKALPKPSAVDADPAKPADAGAAGPPASHVEETILTIWRDVLGVKHAGVHDNFFDLGGHSLLAVKAHRRLKEAFQRDLAITDLFRFPTVRALAGHLQGDAPDGAADRGQERADTRRELMARRARGRVRAGQGPDET